MNSISVLGFLTQFPSEFENLLSNVLNVIFLVSEGEEENRKKYMKYSPFK